jgi:hypothetical protein
MLDEAGLFGVFPLGEKSGFEESRTELEIFRWGETRFLEFFDCDRTSANPLETGFLPSANA